MIWNLLSAVGAIAAVVVAAAGATSSSRKANRANRLASEANAIAREARASAMMTEADRCIRSLALVDSRFQHMCSEHLPERRFTEEQQLRGSKEALSVYVRYWGEAVEESLGRARTLITDEALVQQFTNLHSQAIDVLTLMTDLEGTLTASEPRESYALAREKLLTAAQEHVAATNAFRDSIRMRGAQPQQMPLDPTSRENGQDAR